MENNDFRCFPILFGLIHLVIDATTVMVIFSTRLFHEMSHLDAFLLVLAYDVLAFAGQAPLGMLVDKMKFPKITTIFGIIIAGISVAFLWVEPYAAMLLAAVGNAAFHVGAGALSLHVTPGRATAPGIFVAPGVLGLAIGTFVGKGGWVVGDKIPEAINSVLSFFGKPDGVILVLYALALSISLVVSLLSRYPTIPYEKKPVKLDIPRPILIISLLLFSIVIRSLVGKAGAISAPKETMILISIAMAAFAGKAIGGVLSDRFGWIFISVAALLISAPLIAFGGAYPVTIVFGMLLFQMTMPVTLVATYSIIPGRPGLAFGLNCLAYIIGFLPNMFRSVRAYYNSYLFLALILLSATAVYFGLRALKGKVKMKFG